MGCEILPRGDAHGHDASDQDFGANGRQL